MFDRILITGASGLLGSNLSRQFASGATVIGLYHAHPVRIEGVRLLPCDLTDYAAIRAIVAETAPDLVVHCASRTDVDRMESDPEGAWTANVLTTRNLVDALRDVPGRLVYISSDSVYPGDCGASREDSVCAPRNVYGRTKLEGEEIVLGRAGSLILRTNIYGWNIQNKMSLGEWFLSRLERGNPCTGFGDVFFSGIYTRLFGRALLRCLDLGIGGVYNCACRDSWTKLAFGRRLAELAGFDPGLVREGRLVEASLAAERGLDMTLDVSRLEGAFGELLPTMEESLACFVEDWRKNASGALRAEMLQVPEV
ncbi:MAG: SDR family oxidoreductase [Pseudodesulfovibrio sp.]